MKKETDKPMKKTDPLPVVRKLLRLQREHNKWRREIESSAHVTLDDPIGGKLLYHLALDLLGVTPENLEEVEDFYVLMVTPTDRNSIDGFIDLVTGKQVLPETNNVFELEEALDRVSRRAHKSRL